MDKEVLKKEIANEFENLSRLAKEMSMVLRAAGDNPDSIEVRAAGSILHDFYSGVEKIFKRIAIGTNGTLPKGRDWHTELLVKMTKPMPKLHNAVLSPE